MKKIGAFILGFVIGWILSSPVMMGILAYLGYLEFIA